MRLTLGSLVFVAFFRFRSAVETKFGIAVAKTLVLVCACQFHFPFYMSRPLPNVFALALGTYWGSDGQAAGWVACCNFSGSLAPRGAWLEASVPKPQVTHAMPAFAVLVAYAHWLEGRQVKLIRIVAFSITVFRSGVVR